MKKKAVRLAVAAALLAVLTTAFFVIKNLTKKEEKQGPITVSQTPVKDIEGITYRCEATKGEPISLVREKDIWYYEKDKEFPLDQVFVTNTMAVSAAEAVSKAERTIENPEEDLSQYGLDQPVLTVILKKITGDEVKLNVGSYNAGVEGYYLQVEGDQKLYLIDATMVFAFDVSVYDIADKEDYPYVEAGSFTHIAVQKGSKMVELKGEVQKDSQEVLSKQYYLEKEKTWSVSQDGSAYQEGNQTAVQELISQLASFDYSKMIEYRADEKKREEYGLGDKAVILTVDYQVLDETTAKQVEIANGVTETVCDTLDKQYVLRIGDKVPEDGYSEPEYYVCLEGAEVVYTIRAELLDPVVNIRAESFEK